MILRNLVLADDLTGALEAGALYGAHSVGATVEIADRLPEHCQSPALVLDLEVRHASAGRAQSVVAQVMAEARNARILRPYLKIDSTLRGQVGAEINGVFEAWPECNVIVAPAYPAMGRTVVDGVVFVGGAPLTESAFATDPLNPSQTSSLAACVSGVACASMFYVKSAGGLSKALAERPKNSMFLCDSADTGALADLASVLAKYDAPCVCVGSSGLLSALTTREHGIRAATGLIVNGSLNHASSEQCAALAGDLPSIELADEQADQYTVESALELLRARGWVVLSTGSRVESCAQITQRVSHVTARILEAFAIDSLVVFGGDTTAGILSRLGIQTIRPVRPLLPGVPASRITVNGRNVLLVTKAGGFGGPDTLLEIRSALSGIV